MKKMITKFLLSVSAFAVCLGFMGAPVYAYAEDGSAVSAPSTETSASFTEESDNEPENSVQTPTTNDNASVEETPKTDESEENTSDVEHGFQDFLSWVEQEANRYGYGDEYASALEAIKAAATEKQVTMSTVGSFLLMAATIAYTIYNKIKDKKFKNDIAELSTGLNKQLEKLNELVNGTNTNTKTGGEIKEEEKALKEETTKIKNALESLINGFMHFTSAIRMSNVNKEEVRRDCIKALNCIDGEVKSNEDHKE